jgi:TolB-like protein/Tfp pilus assembly protein PilF
MSLPPGRRLGPYEILSPLGAGGMGEVLKAKDTRLQRTVAVKVLTSELASDAERRSRFEREAHAASALNHPNITTVFDIGEEEGTHYIVMELVEGKTLRELLNEGPLPTEMMLPLATQIAGGLGKAHAAGIVHRDLKPENLMVTEDGLVKILDFGLAKLMPQSSDVESEAPTETRATRQGAVLGTVPYMSPEQAASRALDYRSDQFSFGSILYEMATGQRAFQKDTTPETLAAIIKDDPKPIRKLNDTVPVALSPIVERCLAKDPAGRYESTADLAKELQAVPEAPSAWRAPRRVLWTAVGVLIALLAVAMRPQLAGLWHQLSSRAGPAPIESIVVLPLRNLSGDSEQEYFADGMTEGLITNLAKIGALKVISRSAAMRYKGTDMPLAEVASDLEVDAVVEGSAVRVGDSVQIMAQLIDPETEQALWAESYERKLENVLVLQGEVAQAIAGKIGVALTPEETGRLERVRSVDPAAHDAYLKGTYQWKTLTPEALDTAQRYFELALENDPSYAPAYGGISFVWMARATATAAAALPHEAAPKSREAALRSLELDNALAEPHFALAAIATWYDWDWPTAEREFRRALELNPNFADAHCFYALFLTAMGRLTEARAQMERALELDPFSFMYRSYLGIVHERSRRYDEAIAQYNSGLALEPNFVDAWAGLRNVFHMRGMREDALDSARRVFDARGEHDALEALEQGNADGGYSEAMRRAAESLAARGDVTHAIRIATHYTYAGENERALEWLEEAYQARLQNMIYLRVYPKWDPLRSEPRFQDLIRRINYPE